MRLQTDAAEYLMAAALGIRLAAGIFDAVFGWRRAIEHNYYDINLVVEEEPGFSILPVFKRDSAGVGVNIRL